jgi:hypothetical protein
MHSTIHGRNPQKVLTIPNGSALVVELTVGTTPPKEDKVDTSSVEAPMAQALVARLGSKAPDDNLRDDELDLLNFTMVES